MQEVLEDQEVLEVDQEEVHLGEVKTVAARRWPILQMLPKKSVPIIHFVNAMKFSSIELPICYQTVCGE